MRLAAEFYEPDSPRGRRVTLTMLPDGNLRLAGDGVDRHYQMRETRISDRVGHVVRRFEFFDGALAEVADNDRVDEFLRAFGYARGGTRMHALEQRWGWAIAAVVVLAVAAVAWIAVGVPAVANAVASRLPPQVEDRLGVESLAVMDRLFLAPSRLDEAVRERVGQRFVLLTEAADVGAPRLLFRSAERLGANAFALPSGTIVLTDQLIELAGNDDEIAAVLAHELGHVRGRHTLRLILQDSITAALLAVVVGDVTAITGLAGAVPTLLVQGHYSRRFELEADDYALALMSETAIDPRHFAAILRRLEAAYGDDGAPHFLSTHPATEDRLKRFE